MVLEERGEFGEMEVFEEEESRYTQALVLESWMMFISRSWSSQGFWAS